MSKRKGFTLNDLLAAVAIVVLLAPVVLALASSRELARRASCKSNIRSIGMGLALYSSSTTADEWPWLNSDNQWDAATGAGRLTEPSDKTKYNVSALLFLLVRNDVTTGIFVCPSTRDEVDEKRKTGSEYNWDFSPWKDGNAEHVSYSYQAPLVADKKTRSGIDSSSDSNLVVLADRTPAYDGLKPDFNWTDPGKGDPNLGMSQNHGGGVINVLYADLHVGDSRRGDCGIKNDNIYSAAVKGKDGKPLETDQGPGSMKLSDHLSPKDSFLLGPKRMEK